MSRRAIRRAYRTATGDAMADVRDIAARADSGDDSAPDVLGSALTSLFQPWFLDGAGAVELPPIEVAAHPATAPLVGAARHATGAISPSP